MSRYKKRIIIFILLVAVLVIASGYAILEQELTITGTGNITSNWDVRISGITSVISGNAYNIEEPSFTDTTARFYAAVKDVNDSITYRVTIHNYGDIKAKVNSLTYNESGTSSVVYTVQNIENQVINPGADLVFQVTTTYSSSIGSIPVGETTKRLKVAVDLIQMAD